MAVYFAGDRPGKRLVGGHLRDDRGFLIQYFRHEPLHLNLIPALLLACAIFGIAHLYQGVKGIAGTAFLALVFTAIFVKFAGAHDLALSDRPANPVAVAGRKQNESEIGVKENLSVAP